MVSFMKGNKYTRCIKWIKETCNSEKLTKNISRIYQKSKVLPLCLIVEETLGKRQNKPKGNKNNTGRMFNANNISVRGYVRHIRLQAGAKNTLTPSRQQVH